MKYIIIGLDFLKFCNHLGFKKIKCNPTVNLSKFLSNKSILREIVAKFCPIEMAFVLSIIKQNFPLPNSQQEGT